MPTIAQQQIKEGEEAGQKKGRKEGLEEGLREGRKEGERKATLKGLNQILTIRFDVVLGEFDEQFELLELKSLEQLNEMALTVRTLAEFEKAVADRVSTVGAAAHRADNDEKQEK